MQSDSINPDDLSFRCPSLQTIRQKLDESHQAMNQEGEIQKVVLAGARTIIGVVAITYSPVPAIFGGILGVTMPVITQGYCTGADFTLNRIWNNMSWQARLTSGAAGIGLLALGMDFSLLNIPCAIFSSKIGAELGVRNYNR